jgi:F-type H+-transporting ATPase subunit b
MKTVQNIKGKLLYLIFFLLSSNCLAAEGMPQFNAKSFNSQLFWLIITFTALYIIITYLILPRVRENIRLRKNKISNDLERAESIKLEIENMISVSNMKFEEAKAQAQKIIKETVLRSNREFDNQIDSLKKQIANTQIENERKIAEYKNNLEKDIENSAISLCAVILSKLNYKNFTADKIKEKLSNFNMSNNV